MIETVPRAGVSLIGAGREAEVYRYDTGNVYKLFRRSGTESSARREQSALELLRKTAYPVPEPRGLFQKEGRFGVKMEFLSGSPLDEALACEAEVGTKVGSDLALLHARLHEQSVDSTDLGLPMASAALRLAADERIPDLLLSRTSGVAFCHGDFHPANIMTCSGKLYVIDWSKAFFGPREADMATTLVRFRTVALSVEESGDGDEGVSQSEQDTFQANLMRCERSYLATYERAVPIERELVNQWFAYLELARQFRELSRG